MSPCPLPDGNLADTLPRPATTTTSTAGAAAAPVAGSVTVDLGRAAEVSLVVVRGCSCEVERSTDGQTWTAIGRATGYTAVVPSRTGPARFVRLTGSIGQLREVSVWEGTAPPPAPAGAPPGDAPAPAAVGVPAPAGAPTEPRSVPSLIALGLLVLAAIGTAAGAVAARER